MNGQELSQLIHDLGAPLARATTYSKLLEEAAPADRAELLRELRKALADLESQLKRASEQLTS